MLALQLGIDLDDLTNPYQAAVTSALSFCIGAGLPLLAGAFIQQAKWRILSVVRPQTPSIMPRISPACVLQSLGSQQEVPFFAVPAELHCTLTCAVKVEQPLAFLALWQEPFSA